MTILVEPFLFSIVESSHHGVERNSLLNLGFILGQGLLVFVRESEDEEAGAEEDEDDSSGIVPVFIYGIITPRGQLKFISKSRFYFGARPTWISRRQETSE